MTINELRYIVAVAHYKHFGKASSSCYVSQPTLSMAIKKIEEQFDVLIFERKNNDVQITPIGEQLVRQAEKILNEIQNFKQIAETDKNPFNSPLKLGVIYTIAPYLLPKMIPTLRKINPNLTLHIQENFTHNLLDSLRKNQLDALILSEPIHYDGLSITPLYDEPFYVAMPLNHELLQYQRISSELLSNENLVLLSTGNCFRDQVLKVCPQFKISNDNNLQKTLEGSSLQTIFHMVACGMGITILPSTAIFHGMFEKNLVEIRPFDLPTPSRRIILVTKNNFLRIEVLNVLKQAILESNLTHVNFI